LGSLLHTVLFDLKQRSSYFAEELERLRIALPPAVSQYREDMAKRLATVRRTIDRLLIDPGLKHPRLAQNYFYDYKRLSEFLYVFEQTAFVALGRFSTNDHLMSLIVKKVCEEIGFPYKSPICSATSTDYYFTYPSMDVIFVPGSEPFHLLATPDLYHELAHFVLQRDRPLWADSAQISIDEHYGRIIREKEQQNWPTAAIDDLFQHQSNWKTSWCSEIMSDLIATYWVGPAFGWENLRLCTNQSSDIFDGGLNHPADEARHDAIQLILLRMGLKDRAVEIDKKWHELLSLTGQQKPPNYDLTFPSQLLESLTDLVESNCRTQHLVAMTDFQGSGESNIGQLLNKAWEKFVSEPDKYADFEAEELRSLRSEFGIHSL